MVYRVILILTALAFLSGCRTEPTDAAAAGASTASAIPVGPIPGGGETAPQLTNPFANDRGAMQQGRQLFVQYNCSGCHGGHAGGGMGPSLRDAAWIYGHSDAAVFDSIAQGRSQGMPAWGSKLPQKQIWQLVAYVKSLRTKNEPEPPEQ